MDLFYLSTILAIAVPTIFYLLLRLFLYMTSWYLSSKFSIKLKINRIGIFSIREVVLSLPHTAINIEIECIGFSSKLINAKYNSLIIIKMTDVRFEGDFISAIKTSLSSSNQNVTPSTSLSSEHQLSNLSNVLKSVSILRFITICLENTSLMQLSDNKSGETLVHTTIQTSQFSLSPKRSKTSIITSQIDGITLKFLKHVNKLDDGETCLAHISLSLLFNLYVSSNNQPSFELFISNPQLILYHFLPFWGFNDEEKSLDTNYKVKDNLLIKKLINQLKTTSLKHASIKIANSSLKLVRESGQKALITTIGSIEADVTKVNTRECEARLMIVSMNMLTTSAVISSLNRVNFICKIEQEKSIHQRMQLYLLSEVSSCHLNYSEEEIRYWIELMHNISNKNPAESLSRVDNHEQTSIKDILQKEITKFVVSLDVNDISLTVKPTILSSFSSITYGLNHTKISCGLNYDPLFKEASFELLLETLWCWNGDKELRPANPNSLKKYHQKHVPLFMTMLLAKCQFINFSDVRFHCVMDGLQASFDYFLNLINRYELRKYSRRSSSSNSLNNYIKSSSIQINISSVNIFTSDLMLRLDAATIDSNTSKLTTSINGLAITTMYAPSATLSCLRAAELLQHRILYFSVMRINCNHDVNEVSISLTEEIYVQWNVAFHLTMIDLCDELMPKLSGTTRDSEKTHRIQSALIHLKLDGKISIGAMISNVNHMNLQTEYLALSLQVGNRLNLKSDLISVNFDDHSIMVLENMNIIQLPETEAHTLVHRKHFRNPTLEVKRNKAIAVMIENVSISFPYGYNFGDVFNEKLVTIIKWLRLTHKSDSRPDETLNASTAPVCLPIDINIKIQTASMEVADDPFEVKLHYNYELLEDEQSESAKRWQMLSEKIEERKRKNILLPSSKLEELHAAFAKQNSKTYIDRSNKLYEQPVRTRLFCVKIDGLDLDIVADSSYNSYDKMVNILRRIDKESPFPEDIKFSLIWCRKVNGIINSGLVLLRDFPHSMMDVKELKFVGTVLGGEQEASNRAKRTCLIDVGPNFEQIAIQRSMTTLKFYHDLTLEANSLTYTHGACWEPVLQQLSLSFELITKPSLDPSPSLSWWDKMRFLFHGPLVIVTQQLSLFFHASLDPYNSTELIEIAAYKSVIDWLTGKILMKGDLDLKVHTASKYDECRIVHLPHIQLVLNLQWVCAGNKNDHHSVMSCAPDKVPEYSSNQMHDSYRSFRSHNLNVSASLDTKSSSSDLSDDDIPQVVFYSSALRWLENKMFMISGLARLTRRGKLFGNVKQRKQSFGRIFKAIRVAIYLHKFKVSYWSSFSKQRGCEILSENLSHSAEHIMSLGSPNDGLKHRQKPKWDISYMNTELSNVEIWLYKKSGTDTSVLQDDAPWFGDRKYFLSLKRVSYTREAKTNVPNENDSDEPIHKLVIHDLKGAWTKDNRDVAFGLFDSYVKAQLLKRNISTDALKGFKVEGQSNNSPGKSRSLAQSNTSPASTISKSHAASMLQKLIAESDSAGVVYTEDIENAVATETPQLHGVAACQTNDVIQKNWLIELINSQVMLRGCETEGYVIVSAAKAQILQSIHRPVWKNRTLYSKTTWQGSLECMQYYATVDVDAKGIQNDNIVWLGIESIEERNDMSFNELPDLVGSGHSVGGVVSSVVGISGSESNNGSSQIQLQRIVSRCNCQFFYASFGENVDVDELPEVPPLPEDDLLMLEPWDREIAVDSFTLTHHDLEISTNSLQFSMIVDLVNNLLLYVEPHKKDAYEKQQRIRFAMQLTSVEDQREPISHLQDQVRHLLAKLKRLEKENYVINKALLEEKGKGNCEYEEKLMEDCLEIEHEIDECKNQLNVASEDLTIMINCYREAQVSATKARERQAAAQEAGGFFISSVIRRNEVCFKHASWRLTDADGQLGLADLVLSNFLYTKVMRNDDSVDHSFELGFIHVSNLLPNQVYKDVLQPTELQPNIPLDRHRALRIFCRENAPVGGIPVKEHLEINVIPFTIGLTYAFFKSMMKFFFPDRETQSSSMTKSDLEISEEHQDHPVGKASKKKSSSKKDESASSNSGSTIVSRPTSTGASTLQAAKQQQDNIEKMRERASKNHLFVYIKIPEVPIRVSYKGKTKGIDDLHSVSLILPTVEYHNRTWTWLDLLMALKIDSRRVLLGQALKQKFHISLRNRISPSVTDPESSKQTASETEENEQDMDKARLLLGDLAVPANASQKSTKSKGLSLFSHKK